MTDESNAKAIIDLAVTAHDPAELEPGKVYAAAIPQDGELQVIDLDPESRLDHPRRKSGTVKVQSADSFVAYLKKHGNVHSEVYADGIEKTIVGVINAGTSAPGENGIDEGLAGWGDHRVEYPVILSDEWVDWMENDGKMMPQLAFAEFIEDHQSDVHRPAAAEMLEVAQSIIATSSVNFESSKRLSTGEVQLEYREEIDAKAGKGSLDIPTIITLGLRPFVGCTPYLIDARFRYRINAGNLHLSYKLVEPEAKIRDAFETVVNDITEQVGDTLGMVFDGVPAAPHRAQGSIVQF